MSKGNDVDEAVVATLGSVTGKSVYFIRVPDGAGTNYICVYPLDGPRGEGSWADPEEDRDYRYQVTSVGSDSRQVRWLQGMVEQAFLKRAGGGGYQHAITPAGGTHVLWRLSDTLGAIVPSGDVLFKADDTYRVRIGK